MQLTLAGDILIKKTGEAAFRAPDVNETHALVAGLTCGRPSNPGTGEDECHAEASYAIIDKNIKENRNHATEITGNDGRAGIPTPPTAAATTPSAPTTPAERLTGWGGNDNRDSKTGHVAGSFEATGTHGSYAPIAGCTSCHDQTDSANTVAGNFTFPHGQTPTGITNATAVGGGTGTGVRSRIWSGWSGSIIATKTVTDSTTKAYDGQCLKCHRDGAGERYRPDQVARSARTTRVISTSRTGSRLRRGRLHTFLAAGPARQSRQVRPRGTPGAWRGCANA